MHVWEWRHQLSPAALAQTPIKGMTALIDVGAAARLGVKRNQREEQGDGEVERPPWP